MPIGVVLVLKIDRRDGPRARAEAVVRSGRIAGRTSGHAVRWDVLILYPGLPGVPRLCGDAYGLPCRVVLPRGHPPTGVGWVDDLAGPTRMRGRVGLAATNHGSP
jgi:hypothetical protein